MTIVHIIGLPGAGKTTLAEKIECDYDLPIFRIGEYRAKYPMTYEGENKAWYSLSKGLKSYQKEKNCILETTGLNLLEEILPAKRPVSNRLVIKLVASKKTLQERIKKKKKREQGGKWLFQFSYPDKFTFVDKLYKRFEDIPANIMIDTNEVNANVVYDIAMRKLLRFRIF
ncbi:MAG: hypothetical protein HY920_06045 [Elusimicrobia bacterium]|nr:hypothetical protein [Elusimicrobiota bacterium]